ncbi:hypothetical protein KSP40_PGU010211 [Platanthera guangdongensis]|uniref:Uncharacterized protein n=1 Tax=Platanthera guangdongensis TaxID=2320717 RepID=A0ABR2ML28_9ASPA
MEVRLGAWEKWVATELKVLWEDLGGVGDKCGTLLRGCSTRGIGVSGVRDKSKTCRSTVFTSIVTLSCCVRLGCTAILTISGVRNHILQTEHEKLVSSYTGEESLDDSGYESISDELAANL